ncbi:MAG TPA: phosphopantetheine-binding protein [Nonomuraea sp.]|nr:phosphopantetheine-binding protein [Nonomuraea sp.]
MRRSLVEKDVTQIWNSVLGVTGDASDATFCELGGQAVAAIRIVAGIEHRLGVTIELGTLFADGTLDGLLRHVLAKTGPGNSGDAALPRSL